MADDHTRGLQLRSTVNSDETLDLRLITADTPPPGTDEVVVRVEAAPINPSDLGLVLAGADPATAEATGSPGETRVTAPLPPAAFRAAAARVGQSLPAGNEGAGTVVAAGSSPEAQALIGKTVAIVGGGMYSQYRTIRAKECLLLPENTSAVDGAACFVNPLTVLGMVETMRMEGHTALVHTAAASNLGQMLVKLCLSEGVELVNIVRRDEHVALLRSLGAKHVCNSSDPGFMESLVDTLTETGATIAFDATGGGQLASRLLTAMEAAAARKMTEFSRYGSTVHKQVYIYGGLDRSPTVLTRNYGTFWGLGGWLLTPFLEKVGPQAADRLRAKVAAEVKTTFASHYTAEIALKEVLDLDTLRACARMATGEKYLIRPHR